MSTKNSAWAPAFSPPLRAAVAEIPATSEPDSASVMA
jgi:hypothetical protein